MIPPCLEYLGLGLCIFGTILMMMSCGLPMWKVTAFIDKNIVVAETSWDGLWMSCVVRTTGQMQCKWHDSMLALSTDVQTARALTVTSSVLGIVALVITIAGAQWTNCITTEAVKTRVVNAGGVVYIISGLLAFVPLCWIANNIIVAFYNPSVTESQKREIGASIYIGWAATALQLVGGIMLCSSCQPPRNAAYSVKYPPPPKMMVQNGDYDKKNYV